MFGKMQVRRPSASSSGQYPLESVIAGSAKDPSDMGVLTSISEAQNTMAVMVWIYHDHALLKPDAQIVSNTPRTFSGCETRLTLGRHGRPQAPRKVRRLSSVRT